MKRLAACAACVLMAASGARAEGTVSLRDAIPATDFAAPRAFVGEYGVETAADNAPISPTRAVLYSLLLPGLGDYQLGNKGRATAFFAAEGIIWISFAVFEVQGHQREDEYRDLAVRFAGVSHTGHSDEFYATLRDYDNSDEYEADVKLEARAEATRVEDIDPDALEAYFVANRVDDFEPWLWTSHDRRLQYSEVRSSSKTSYRRADYMLAAAAANRVVSAVVAFTAARSARPEPALGYHLDFTPRAHGVDVALTLTRSF